MSPRLAPALGLAAACVLLTGVGAVAISIGSGPVEPTEIAGAVLRPSSLTSTARSVLPSRVNTDRAVRATPTSLPHIGVAAATPPAPSSTVPVGPTPSTAAAALPAGSSAVPASPGAGFAAGAPAARSADSTPADQWAQAVFQAVNQARTAHALAALSWSGNLQLSAHRHNLAMAASDTLSHQVPGEAGLGARETAAGVSWTFAAENIAWTTDRTAAGALAIESQMYAETAPDDAHKRNILSRSVTAVGIDVYLDAAHGRLWLTEDFSGYQP
ncbi:MAG TPA: CAP domain-containing protein [Jatrophihabitans sp.]|nr:CAP domain-containing protein [Jatrophihabitans sp.]